MENKDNKRKDQPSSASTNHHRRRNVKPKLTAVTPPNPEPQDQEIRELQTLSLFPTEPSSSSSHSQVPEFSSPPQPPPALAVVDDLNIVIPPPFPWATDRPAKIHTLQYLNQNKILTITGDVQCGSCHKKFEMEFDLKQKAAEHGKFLKDHRDSLHNRCPKEWMNPNPIACKFCGKEKCVKPVIGSWKEHSINWLFLWLGQFIGFCTLEDLRYFCKYNKLHRTAAKDRLVFNAYTEIFKQLIQAD
ncbi:hypothetical protein HN51_060716 [Arachis hypogaea]|uniref:DUF7086 domain-containing protein n=1 Tax=Arachis hypogaea TaxID=3818 RepID=A0A444XAN5_ARAHY|nr:uncharacterized protein LOC107624158 [Arachis ipaensis]XP_025681916.1 uncharacterized protein LOC112783265 [Arachis hypogaea]RYQ86749.1 hypothetical protein Ahy_B10g106385 [Arachis hypogaea]